VGAGSDLLRDVAGITLPGARPEKLLDLLEMATFARRVARGNIAWAVGYNLLALPFAVAGQVTPVVAAVAMFGSSLAVIGNSLRLLKGRGDSRRPRPAHSASIGKVMEAPNQPMIVTRTESPRTSRM
jgi:Cu2+-exporting ATPase